MAHRQTPDPVKNHLRRLFIALLFVFAGLAAAIGEAVRTGTLLLLAGGLALAAISLREAKPFTGRKGTLKY